MFAVTAIPFASVLLAMGRASHEVQHEWTLTGSEVAWSAALVLFFVLLKAQYLLF